MGGEAGLEVSEEPEGERFVVRIDGEVAGAAYYRRAGGRVIFTHTEVSDAFQGRGVGSALARGALDAVRGRGELVVPLCPFIAGYIEGHPEYADLVDEELLGELRAAAG
jgi:predicted GNAT family acetyltransferase